MRIQPRAALQPDRGLASRRHAQRAGRGAAASRDRPTRRWPPCWPHRAPPPTLRRDDRARHRGRDKLVRVAGPDGPRDPSARLDAVSTRNALTAFPRARRPIAPVRWEHDRLILLDQRLLPGQELERAHARWEDVADAIRTLVVRGAPAIGVAAALRHRAGRAQQPRRPTSTRCSAISTIALKGWPARGRPRSISSGRSIGCARVAEAARDQPVADIRQRLLTEAHAILDEDLAANRALGDHGATLVPPTRASSRTATPGRWPPPATAPRSASCARPTRQGKVTLLWVDETRPVMQGSRLTAWECVRDGIPHRLIADVAGRLGDGARSGRSGRDRRRSHRRQRRHRQQDRHLRAGGAGASPSRALLHRRAVLDDRSGAAVAARRFRSRSATRSRFAGSARR